MGKCNSCGDFVRFLIVVIFGKKYSECPKCGAKQ